MLTNYMNRQSVLIAIIMLCIGCSPNPQPADEPIVESSPNELPKTSALINPPKRSATKVSRIPIYITPYYNSEGLQINVGRYSKELSAVRADSIDKLSATMKTEWAILPIETMYVMSIRLYDLGRKDEAVYWFYSAQYRAKLFRSLLKEVSRSIGSEDFERIHAHNSFQQLAGEYINGYAFGKLDKLQETIRLVISENKTLPELKTVYPELVFIDSGAWSKKNKDIAAGLDKLLNYLAGNAEVIKAIREENGIEGKY